MRKKGGSKILQFPYLCYLQNRHNIFEHGTCTGERRTSNSDPRIDAFPHTQKTHQKKLESLYYFSMIQQML